MQPPKPPEPEGNWDALVAVLTPAQRLMLAQAALSLPTSNEDLPEPQLQLPNDSHPLLQPQPQHQQGNTSFELSASMYNSNLPHGDPSFELTANDTLGFDESIPEVPRQATGLETNERSLYNIINQSSAFQSSIPVSDGLSRQIGDFETFTDLRRYSDPGLSTFPSATESIWQSQPGFLAAGVNHPGLVPSSFPNWKSADNDAIAGNSNSNSSSSNATRDLIPKTLQNNVKNLECMFCGRAVR
ncbi:hypothetical protein BCR33DRAFT_721983 [Rhizoclosmatium globosum]|uniref:Uncharacterized protein n=1 Tax=Rhizoclosmatium globosum TaxID=329046 RepID=A0A1Y2BPE0_9FUNG|nr:hypothetical protein BCR33DRAFT_721983 [Rhizoclosmatium globosum]|eukprot:ORY36457.1 hypothetical protein BCR33DRAFT_721983 [Rhizoclosmatium globosum]